MIAGNSTKMIDNSLSALSTHDKNNYLAANQFQALLTFLGGIIMEHWIGMEHWT